MSEYTLPVQHLLERVALVTLVIYGIRTLSLFLVHGFEHKCNSVHALGIGYATLSAWLIWINLPFVQEFGRQINQHISSFGATDVHPLIQTMAVITGYLVLTAFLCNCAKAVANLTALDLGEFEGLSLSQLGQRWWTKAIELVVRLLCVYLFLFLEQSLIENGGRKFATRPDSTPFHSMAVATTKERATPIARHVSATSEELPLLLTNTSPSLVAPTNSAPQFDFFYPVENICVSLKMKSASGAQSISDLGAAAACLYVLLLCWFFAVVWVLGVPLFSTSDFIDLPALVKQLLARGDPVSVFLWNQLTPKARQVLTDAKSSTQKQQSTLKKALNRVLRGSCIYDSNRFVGTTLSSRTVTLKSQKPQSADKVLLNRLLLEDAYHSMIRRHKARKGRWKCLPLYLCGLLVAAFLLVFGKVKTEPANVPWLLLSLVPVFAASFGMMVLILIDLWGIILRAGQWALDKLTPRALVTEDVNALAARQELVS